jgi:PLP dependent protein
MENPIAQKLQQLRQRLQAYPKATLIAVSKTQAAERLREAFAAGQRAFGENYVQEAIAKQQELADLNLDWHFIGPLQSNKAELVAQKFAWLHSLDRAKLIPILAKARSPQLPPLNVLIQINIDDEASKSGCAPADLMELAVSAQSQAQLRLRGLMCIPRADANEAELRASFKAMHALFEMLRTQFPSVDTLSMGMSGDFEIALQEGATMIRVGSAIFGARKRD